MKRIPLIAAVILGSFALWFVAPIVRDRQRDSAMDRDLRARVAAAQQPSLARQPQTPDSGPQTPTEASPAAAALNSPASDIRADLRVLDEIVSTFRTNFPRTGNPAGNNAEITAALTGKNKLRLALIPPHHPAINAEGELCDRWGTPFFFHAESATRMEFRSAGPDKKMWNEDDIVLTP